MFRNFYDVSFNKKSINKKYTAWSIWVEVFGKSFNSRIWKKLSRWHEELLLNLRRIFFKICIEKNFTNGEDLFGKFSATKYLDSRRGNPVIPTFRDLFVKFYLCEKFSRKAKLEPPSHRPRFLIKQRREARSRGRDVNRTEVALYF